MELGPLQGGRAACWKTASLNGILFQSLSFSTRADFMDFYLKSMARLITVSEVSVVGVFMLEWKPCFCVFSIWPKQLTSGQHHYWPNESWVTTELSDLLLESYELIWGTCHSLIRVSFFEAEIISLVESNLSGRSQNCFSGQVLRAHFKTQGVSKKMSSYYVPSCTY